MNKKCKKVISFFTALTTILWLVGGIAMPSPAGAVTLKEGDLIRGPDGIKVYIINANGYRRHIFNPEVFNMYGHLKWSDIKSVDQATLDSYSASDFYRVANSPKVFSVTADGQKRWLDMTAEQFVASGYHWDQIFIVNDKEGNYYTTGTAFTYTGIPIATPTPTTTVSPTATPVATPTGPLAVTLASDNPISANIPFGVTAAPFLKFNVSGPATINEIVIKRGGAGNANDFTNVYLYDGATRLTGGRSVASDTNTATFVNLGLAVGTGKTLTIKADIAIAWITVSGRQDNFSLVSIDSTAVTGIAGNLMSYANVTAGTVTIAETSAAWQITLGSTVAEMAKFSIQETSGVNDLFLNGITLRHSGTLNSSYITKLVMKVGTTQVGTCAALTTDKAIFVFPSAYTVPKGQTKNFVVYGDLAGGRADDKIQFYLDESSDLNATDATYGYGPVLTNGYLTAEQVVTVAGGQITIGNNGPSAQSIASNTTNVDFLKFSLTADRAVTIKKLKLTAAIKGGAPLTLIAEGTTASVVEDWDYLKNIKIVDLTSGNTIVGPLSDADAGTWLAGTGYWKEFTDQFTLTAGTTRQMAVRADVDTHFTPTNTIEFSIDLSGTSYVYDDSAAQYILAAKIVPNTMTGYQMTVAAASLTLAKASTPVSTTVVKGATGVEGLGIILTAGTADAVKLTKLVVRVYADDGVTTPYNASGYGSTDANTIVSTVSLYDDAGTKVGGPVNLSEVGTTGATGGYYKADFTNLAYSFAAGAQKKFIVKADLLNTFTGTKYIAFDVLPSDSGVEGEDSKGNTLTFAAQNVNLNLADTPSPNITCSQTGTMTVAVDAGTPIESIVVAGSTGVEFTKYKFSATNEAVIIKGLSLTNAYSATAGDYDDNLGVVTLSYPKDAAGTVETKTGYFASGVLTFADGQVGIYVPKDSTAVLTIKADLKTIDYGADSGDAPKIGLTKTTAGNQWLDNAGNLTDVFIVEGVSSGKKMYGATDAITVNNINVKGMTVRKTKPTLAAGTLPSSTLSADSVFYKWTVSADSAADMTWNYIAFNVTGSLFNTTANTFLTLGTDDTTTPPDYDGIYGIRDGNTDNDVQFISGIKVYNSTTLTEVTGTRTYRTVITDSDTGGYYLIFVPGAEEEVGKGATKTYELRGTFTMGQDANNHSGNISVKIADLTPATVATAAYATVVGTNAANNVAAAPLRSFIWSDKSAATHTTATLDWATDYKISGIPTTSLAMSK